MPLSDAFRISKNTILRNNAPKRIENLMTGVTPTNFARSAMGLGAGAAVAGRAALSDASPTVGRNMPGLQRAPAMARDMRDSSTGTDALAQDLGRMGAR